MATDENKQHEKILADAKAFKKEAQAYWHDTYTRATEDKEFVTIEGAQWDSKAKAKRDAESKPTLEINLARTFVRQQINTMRQNRPQIQVVPVDSDADLEVAKILGGLIKDTEEATNAEDTYDQAAENAVFGGLGFLRLATDYVSEDSFNQEPKFLPVENPQAVLIDPMSRRLDGSDMTQCLVQEWVKKSVVESQYGKDATDFDNDTDTDWNDKTKNSVLLAEYFYIEQIKDELLLLSDGTTGFRSELTDQFGDVLDDFIQQSRTTHRTEIKWAKLTGSRVLETGVFPGKYIPIIPVYGEVTWIGEDRHVFSLIHFAKDAQRLFNYWKSTEAMILSKNQNDVLVADARPEMKYASGTISESTGANTIDSSALVPVEQFDAVAKKLANTEVEVERLNQVIAAGSAENAELRKQIRLKEIEDTPADELKKLLDEAGVTYQARDGKPVLAQLVLQHETANLN